MFGNSFYYILNMSIMASFVMIIILLLRLLFGKWLSKSMLVLLWAVVLIRLIIPFSIESPISIGNLFGESFINEVHISTKTIDEKERIDLYFSNYIQLADDYKPISFKNRHMTSWFDIAGIIWIVGLFVMCCYYAVVFYMFGKLKNNAYLVEDVNAFDASKIKYYVTDHINTPMVVGIVKPIILMPQNDYNELNHMLKKVIIQHEKTHISRKDNLWKLIFGLGLCLHWFNPLIWVMSRMISKDIELACDEKALNGLEQKERKNYVIALVDYASVGKLHATAFANSNISNRVFAIINYKKKSVYMIAVTTLICAVVAFVLLTNPTN